MKRKSAILLVLFACCVVVSFCTQNLQAANERLSHRTEAQSQDKGSPGLWQAILDGFAASRGPQANPEGTAPIPPIKPLDGPAGSLAGMLGASSAGVAEGGPEMDRVGGSDPPTAAVRCPELLPFPQLALLAAHSPQEI